MSVSATSPGSRSADGAGFRIVRAPAAWARRKAARAHDCGASSWHTTTDASANAAAAESTASLSSAMLRSRELAMAGTRLGGSITNPTSVGPSASSTYLVSMP